VRTGITTDTPNTTANAIALEETGNPGTDVILGTSRNKHHNTPNHKREVTTANPWDASDSVEFENTPLALFRCRDNMKTDDTAWVHAITDTVSTNMNTSAGIRNIGK
jgi:hypothetical protein